MKSQIFIQYQKKEFLETSNCNGICKTKIKKNKYQLSFFFERELTDFEKLKEYHFFYRFNKST